MGGSSRRKQRRNTAGGEHEEATFHGLSPVFIWILATSLIVVISPPSSGFRSIAPQHSRFADPADHLLDTSSLSAKMYMNHQSEMDSFHQQAPKDEHYETPADKNYFYPQFHRPMGLRWRDDSRMMLQHHQPTVMPILTERSASPFGRGASTSSRHQQQQATSSQFTDSPSLEDMELIDVLWRSDIAGEKGTRPIALADQYECDLQTLTEKSTMAPLSAEEHARYEDLAKSYYQDFYPSFTNNNLQKYQQPQVKTHMPPEEHHQRTSAEHVVVEQMPTDKELADILDDMSHPDSQLNQMFNVNNPIINNASLSEVIVYTPANLTELAELQDPNNQIPLTSSSSSSSSTPSTQPTTLFNSTDPQTIRQWIQPTEITPEDVFPQSNYLYVGMHNDSMQTVVSNGQVDYDHAYQAPTPLSPLVIGGGATTTTASSSSSAGASVGQQTQTSPASASVTATATASLYDSYRHQHQRHSFSDCTDASTPSSRLSSESPRYNSESCSSTTTTESRFYGKLIPARGSRVDRPRSPHSPTRIHRVVPLTASGRRKRGRQSKDEQLACENSLPVSALQISEMTLSDLQQVLKNESLSDYQRQLIRKIRRRGKNKVAARTCRQRRTDRHDKVFSRNSMYN
uniref:BZIP domain-containing protein n=1 Tax=Caenorhabditis japonica TaxID=281687 RepID=A0A8R1IC26_CAEJA